MNTKVKVIAASLLVTSALAACGTPKDNNAMDGRNYNYERTSYNDTHQYRDNVTRNDRYTDYVTYRNGRNGTGYNNYYRDVNYNGQIANPHPTRNITMNNSYINNDGKTAEKITNRVKRMNNVDRVSTVVYGNDVAIAVKPRNPVTNETAMANEVRQAVVNEVGNRNVYVSVRNDMFTRVDAMSTRLRNGTVTNDFNRDITNMFRDIRYGLTGTMR
ncbi:MULTISPECIES: YhcN/YlaJ family sporulation lipoprotein [Bacillus]|uniref:Spore cortex protein n=2 Tax=Bacillus cereus group TaxID=86661 RepID=A0A2A7D9B4_BACAN|nr:MULTISPECIES: YhcN/YlaJ family sporulation lipoprotein [Bacillus]MCP1165558.1 YhcN/YlaJ family sporulation lipoprotein [Bacillus sp. 1813sda1]MDC7976070.1 YhcN/YlaJ family sporulation lipoprotein [Bacillus sp. BLCC-B18]OTW66332.1 spore cortex protein [Bacillus thuringiensis serovar coreanensis]OTX43390.1 spore cortex protein [Bacillus thuringiensis serovar sooncheon]OTX51696.1 spore cortex protein [Bacillus thuringiensis serovar guiyangiensis]